MKKTNNTSTKEYFRSALRAGEDRLLRNPSRGEQALFICVVVLAFVSLIFSVITAIMSKDAMTIIRAFTENVFMFALVTLTSVSSSAFASPDYLNTQSLGLVHLRGLEPRTH